MKLKFKDYELKVGNHFVAMEYYYLILNRTFLVLILDDYLLGLKMNGLIGVEAGGDPLTRAISEKWSISGDLENPYVYLSSKYLKQVESMDIYGDEILSADSANFKISRDQLTGVSYDRSKKWGMGYYPHDGKVYIKTEGGGRREFIILGAQSGLAIKRWIE